MKKEPNSNLRARTYKSWHSDSMDEVNSKTKMTEESMNWRKKLTPPEQQRENDFKKLNRDSETSGKQKI